VPRRRYLALARRADQPVADRPAGSWLAAAGSPHFTAQLPLELQPKVVGISARAKRGATSMKWVIVVALAAPCGGWGGVTRGRVRVGDAWDDGPGATPVRAGRRGCPHLDGPRMRHAVYAASSTARMSSPLQRPSPAITRPRCRSPRVLQAPGRPDSRATSCLA